MRAVSVTSNGRQERVIGSLVYILAVLGRRTGPRGEKMVGRSPGTLSQDLATILETVRVIFVDLGADRIDVFCRDRTDVCC